jgi:UDP-N-acetylglucosamine diphosphorylase/glucosamine-1-phosphate N-acetyltransferase
MINIVFSDAGKHLRLAPLSLNKPISKLKMGLMSFEDRWLNFLKKDAVVGYETESYLSNKYQSGTETAMYLNASVIPTPEIIESIKNLPIGYALISEKGWIAKHGTHISEEKIFKGIYLEVKNLWDMFQLNGEVIEIDFDLMTKNKKSQPLNSTNTLIGDRIFIEEGAKVNGAILNTETGPIYIGKHAEIQEGAMIRGGLGLLEHATIKMGAKIYGPTTIGKHSKVGGEVTNSVIQNYSNKGHDGYMGNSLIGEWCNLGADTNTSNLKNNYSLVSIHSYETNKIEQTGAQFIGLTMGDHSKCGINTMFNTGTVVGISANIYGGDFPPKFIPSFSWGGSTDFVDYDFEKAMETATKVKARRGLDLTKEEVEILKYLSLK